MVHQATERERSLKILTGQSDSPLIVDYLPDPYVTVIVHCEAFQCLSYMDIQGIWRNPFTGTPIEHPVVAWSKI